MPAPDPPTPPTEPQPTPGPPPAPAGPFRSPLLLLVGTLLIAGGGSGVLLLAGERFGALAFASINAISLAFWALLRGPMNELLRAQTNAQAAAGWALTILWSASVVALYLLGYSSLATAIVIVTGLAFLLSAWFIAYGPLHELQNESPRDHDRDQQDD